MQKLIILKGLPASGKTTWSRQWVNKSPKSRIRINRDDIRNMLGPYWIPERENLVTYIETKSVEEALWKGYSVVVDATNFRLKTEPDIRQRFCRGMDVDKVKVIIKEMDIPLKVCIERDKNRNEDQQVGEEVIMRMYNKYLKG